MKIRITGHTNGLGSCLYERLKENNEVIGMSRSNGYDLSVCEDQFVFADFDVYINNAYHAYAQTNLLYKLFEKNKYRYCSIINIGSVSADGNKDVVNEYAIHKASLEKACSQLQLVDSNCKVVHLKIGRMNTRMTDHLSEYPRIDVSRISDAVEWIISQPKNIVVKNLTLDIMHSRRKETR